MNCRLMRMDPRNLISSNVALAAKLLLVLFVVTTVTAQPRQTLGGLEFVGLKRLTKTQLVTMSGLKIGQVVDANILDAAAGELMKTGLFRRLTYRVHNAGNQAVVTFQVE